MGLWETPLEAQSEDRRKSQIKWRCERTCVVHRRFMGDRRFVTWLCVNIFPRFVCSTSGIISTFLHVHPFGASIEYICSYLQRLDTKVTDSHESKLLLWIICSCTGSVSLSCIALMYGLVCQGPAVPSTQAVLLLEPFDNTNICFLPKRSVRGMITCVCPNRFPQRCVLAHSGI